MYNIRSLIKGQCWGSIPVDMGNRVECDATLSLCCLVSEQQNDIAVRHLTPLGILRTSLLKSKKRNNHRRNYFFVTINAGQHALALRIREYNR